MHEHALAVACGLDEPEATIVVPLHQGAVQAHARVLDQ
jgi:hypothetical protein